MQNKSFPNKPWVYIFKDLKWNILYIWKAKNLQKRINQYFSPWSIWKQDMINKAEDIDFLVTQNETEALNLEENLLKEHKPPYNSLLKGNNRFVYIKFTKELFPQIFIVKQKKNDWSTYIWPKYHNKELKKVLQYLRQLFQYRWCKTSQFKQKTLCWDYYFGLCKWRCIFQKNQSNKEINPENYTTILNQIKEFFEWNSNQIQKEIIRQINEAIPKQNFEWANILKNIYLQIQTIVEKQSTTLESNINWYIFEIKNIWNWRIYTICKFFEWKIIDIITNKISKEDHDLESLLNNIKAEFWEIKKFQNWIWTIWIKLTKKITEQIKPLLQNFLDSFIAKNSFEEESLINEILKKIQEKYQFKNLPYHIECLDISHFWWENNSWWISSFIWWIPDKKYYRKFKIQNIYWENWNDFASIKEVLFRRFQTETNLPNTFIIDWWETQLKTIKDLLKNEWKERKYLLDKIDFISIWKWKARTRKWKQNQKEKLYKFDSDGNINSKELNYDQVDRILIQARDEAHRFANFYRKEQKKIRI